jgi:hypothetical protein
VLQGGVVATGGGELVDPVQDLPAWGEDSAEAGLVEEEPVDVAGAQRRTERADSAVGMAVDGHRATARLRAFVDDGGDVGVLEGDVVGGGVAALASAPTVDGSSGARAGTPSRRGGLPPQ